MSLNSTSLSYVFADSLRAVRENFATMFFSALTVGFSLAILSFFVFIMININAMASLWGNSAQVVLYVKDGAIAKGAEKVLLGDLKKVYGVKDATYISKNDALNILKESMEGSPGLLDGLKKNPLPASFEVTLNEKIIKAGKVDTLVSEFGKLKYVEDVQFGKDWVERLGSILGFIRAFTIVVSSFMALAIIFIISNTIRLAVYAKASEIEVLRLIGASDAYIKIPFFIDALFQAFGGALIAFGFLSLGIFAMSHNADPYILAVISTPFSPMTLGLSLLVTAATLSVVASYFSLGKFLGSIK